MEVSKAADYIPTMLETLEKPVEQLEKRVAELSAKPTPSARPKNPWRTYGVFKNDPDFDEAVRLGREYREQQTYEKEIAWFPLSDKTSLLTELIDSCCVIHRLPVVVFLPEPPRQPHFSSSPLRRSSKSTSSQRNLTKFEQKATKKTNGEGLSWSFLLLRISPVGIARHVEIPKFLPFVLFVSFCKIWMPFLS